MKLRPLLGAMILAAIAGCATPPPTASETAPAPAVAADTRPVSVYLVPLDDFDPDIAERMARQFGEEFGLRVESLPPLSARKALPFFGTRQYAAEEIVTLASAALPELPGKAPNASYVVLTNRDINSRSRELRFLFGWHDPVQRMSVISTARLRPDGRETLQTRALLTARLNKMSRRAIGEIQLGWKRTSDVADLMYSPLMNVADVDRIGDVHSR